MPRWRNPGRARGAAGGRAHDNDAPLLAAARAWSRLRGGDPSVRDEAGLPSGNNGRVPMCFLEEVTASVAT
eukprot:4406751-Lingulodinium_polyedra.AAC.1